MLVSLQLAPNPSLRRIATPRTDNSYISLHKSTTTIEIIKPLQSSGSMISPTRKNLRVERGSRTPEVHVHILRVVSKYRTSFTVL
jgi:hypothetical protein